MATEKIYTVSSLDDEHSCGISRCVAGSYRTFDHAVAACIDYIVERLEMCKDIAYSFGGDENHEEATKFFCVQENGYGATISDEAGLREYLRNALELESCYYVWDGLDAYKFDIDENVLED